ncbi:MAG TPA: endonuclease/exonuclease/phosphatase family protein [Pyrinomonadaceae bacterium]|nr:endonuclease/exonuclease/phosphatase family protein [Pyrinomonadaceae bacterium]
MSVSTDGIEIGSRTSSEEAEPRSRLVLASYNIRYAVGRYLIASGLLRKIGYNFPADRTEAIKRNLRVAARIFSNNELLPPPDILALQEADKETGRAGKQHVAARLADELGVAYAHVGAGLPRGIKPKQREWWLNFEEQVAIDDEGDMGVALLSRVPLSDVQRIDLPWHDCAWRPRLAMAVTIVLSEEKLRLFNVHIDPHGPLDNQHQQTEAVLELAEKHHGPVVILGDFNTLSKQKAVEIRKLLESHGYTTPFPTSIPTWRGAGLIRFHADWIFVKGVRVNRWGVARPLNVSDHWPIWAEIETGTHASGVPDGVQHSGGVRT